jgi:hypothetical protein
MWSRQAKIGLMLAALATLVVAGAGRSASWRLARQESDPTKQQAQLVAQLEDDFRSEHRDPKWSDQGTNEAVRALSRDLPQGTKLGKVECRLTMCRVESSHVSVDAFQAFVRSGLLSHDRQLWNGGFSSYVVDQSSSGVSALTFIERGSS